MKRILPIFFLGLLFLIAHTCFAQKQRKANPHEPGEDIYKHYTGTIGKKKIVVDLLYGYQGGSNYGGSAYYTPGKEGVTKFYIGEPDTHDHNVTFEAEEDGSKDSLGAAFADFRGHSPRWQFTIKHDTLMGKWTSADHTEKLDINLLEDYSKSCPLDLYFPKAAPGKAGNFMLAQPSMSANKQWADYINGAKELAAENDEAAKLDNILTSVMPVYNDNGMLVLQKTYGDHNTEVIAYLCLDFVNRRVWEKSDILKSDNAKLSALLEVALRKKYKLDHEKKLSTWFTVEKLPIPKTVMIANAGLNFTYYKGEIYANHMGSWPEEITVFIPYKQLSGLLTPAFKKRMDL